MWKLYLPVQHIDLTPLSLMSMRVRQGNADCPLTLAKVAQQESILPIRKLPHASHALEDKHQMLVPLLAMTPQLRSHQHTQPKSAISAAISAVAIVTMRVLCAQTTIAQTTVEGNKS